MTRLTILALAALLVAGCGETRPESINILPGDYVLNGRQPYYVDRITIGRDGRYEGKLCAECIEAFGAKGYPYNCHGTTYLLSELHQSNEAKKLFEQKAGCVLDERHERPYVAPPKGAMHAVTWPDDEWVDAEIEDGSTLVLSSPNGAHDMCWKRKDGKWEFGYSSRQLMPDDEVTISIAPSSDLEEKGGE